LRVDFNTIYIIVLRYSMTKHWFIAHLIEKYTKNRKFGLDMGIGYDNWAEFKKCEMIGIDRKEDSKAEIIIDLEKPLPFRNDSFDVVISINSFNYVENSRQLLSEVNRILKTDGVLVCVVDNEKSSSHPHVWEQKYLDRVLHVTGFHSILLKDLKDYFYAKWYNRTSVYAFAIVIKSKISKDSSKFCVKCGKILKTNWRSDESGKPCHIKCPIEKTIEYAKSYNIETTHPEH